MLDVRLYILQRATALLMAPLVIGHLAVMIYAVQGGLSASEILSRTQGSVAWFLFYGLFVVAASVHGALGVRVVLHEWCGVSGLVLKALTLAVGGCLLGMGARAVWAVTFA